MPQLPPGQRATTKWPVLDLGRQPKITVEEWRLRVDGLVGEELDLSWSAFQSLEQVEDVSDFHCVTGWSKLDVCWQGVRLSSIAEAAQLADGATHVICHGYDGYTTNLPLEEALKSDVLLVYSADGQPLSREHGGPVRMITPQLYAWKGAKWICRLEFVAGDRLGYWERNGYSNTAHPWQDDRYSLEMTHSQKMQPFILPILQWLGAVLLMSCSLLIWARLTGHPQLAKGIEAVSLLLALGAVPYAIRNAR